MPDQRLPSIHFLAKDLSVNIETIRKAYKVLEKEGLLSMRRAKGTCVARSKRSSMLLPIRVERTGECSNFRSIIMCLIKDGESESEIRKEFNVIEMNNAAGIFCIVRYKIKNYDKMKNAR